MRRLSGILFYLLFSASVLHSQQYDLQLRVFNVEDGLSHRDIFKVTQDQDGFIWITTINGLNRFDGYQFLQFQASEGSVPLPFAAISDMMISQNGQVILSGHDYLASLQPESGKYKLQKVKEGPIVRRASWVPNSLMEDSRGRRWMSTYDEKSGYSYLQYTDQDSVAHTLFELNGQYPRHPIVEFDQQLLVASGQNELLRLTLDGQVLDAIQLPKTFSGSSRVVQLQQKGDRLWILLLDGSLYYIKKDDNWTFYSHPVNEQIDHERVYAAFHLDEQGNVFLAGDGILLNYNSSTEEVIDYDSRVRELVKRHPTYRYIYQDQSGVIWVASNYGVIKLVQSARLFTPYLNGGSEYCSNVLCSIRGMTEDEDGKVYISYYNSIHVLDPATNRVSLLFPANNFFNYPYDLHYFEKKLYTGSSRRIDLTTLKVDTLFNWPNKDQGVVIQTPDQFLWFGFEDQLKRYDPVVDSIRPFPRDVSGWTAEMGQISYLHYNPREDCVWVGTFSDGIYKLDRNSGQLLAHYHTEENSPITLVHNRINCMYQDDAGRLWLGTAAGLQMLDTSNAGQTRVYGTRQGLSNNFVNGILSEGDSALWISTDNGLNRLQPEDNSILVFRTEEGVSHNEFNRNAFLKASDGRMYFGGLDGVNAFYPGSHLLKERYTLLHTPILFTNFTLFDGRKDSIISRGFGLSKQNNFKLHHRDKYFSFSFALADFKDPREHRYSYMLEGYDEKWSPPTPAHTVRYNNIPAGHYTFRVRAVHNGSVWNEEELTVNLHISEAIYRRPWFILLCASLVAGTIISFMRYRIRTIQKREVVLERLVKERTSALEQQKQTADRLLLNILPAETADELKRTGTARARRYEQVSVMFSDFKGFSEIAENMDPEKLVAEIDYCFSAFDQLMDKYQLEKIKTIGDAYMCMVISNKENPSDGPVRLIKAALEFQDFLERAAKERNQTPYFKARIGIHTGPVVAGVVGTKKFAYDIWGDTVNIASRMESFGLPGRVNVSEYTRQIVKPNFNFSYHDTFSNTGETDIKMYLIAE